MASRPTTKTRILDAAEQLFAERGYSDTSLRLITSQAEVNLASVNYHFGSKKSLIQAVVARYLNILMPRIAKAFDELDRKPTISLDDIFDALVEPLMELQTVRKQGTAIFMQLLGRGYIDNQGHLRWFVINHYGEPLKRVNALVHRAAPHLPPEDVFWRLHFTLGSVVFTMNSFVALSDIAEADFAQHNNIEDVIRRLIPFLAAGVGAPAVQVQHQATSDLKAMS